MSRSMTQWGVGPRILLFTFPYVLLMAFVHTTWPQTRIPGGAHIVFVVAGIVWAACGIVLWAAGARVIDRAFAEGRLLTTGAYALVRNPMYSGQILFVMTGVAVALRSWPLLTVPFVAYLGFRLFIPREEKYLEARFGQAYLDYRAKVRAIVPLPRWAGRTRVIETA